MPLRAVGLADIAMSAMNDLIDRVLATRSPLQVLDPVIGWLAVEMSAFHTGRRGTLKGKYHLPMDERFARSTALTEFHNGIAHVVQALLENDTGTTNAAQTARLVETFKSGDGSPFFSVFSTRNIDGVSMFRHTSHITKTNC